MGFKPFEIKEKLNIAIHEASVRFKNDHCAGSGVFTRNRTFTLERLARTIMSMGGGDIAHELENLNIEASKAAFCQQRKKLHHELFEDIFETFNNLCEDCDT